MRYRDLKDERDAAVARALEAERLSMKSEFDRVTAEFEREKAQMTAAGVEATRIAYRQGFNVGLEAMADDIADRLKRRTELVPPSLRKTDEDKLRAESPTDRDRRIVAAAEKLVEFLNSRCRSDGSESGIERATLDAYGYCRGVLRAAVDLSKSTPVVGPSAFSEACELRRQAAGVVSLCARCGAPFASAVAPAVASLSELEGLAQASAKLLALDRRVFRSDPKWLAAYIAWSAAVDALVDDDVVAGIENLSSQERCAFLESQRDNLWALLDNIDTLDDACRSEDGRFRELVRAQQKRRWAIYNPEEASHEGCGGSGEDGGGAVLEGNDRVVEVPEAGDGVRTSPAGERVLARAGGVDSRATGELVGRPSDAK